MRARGVYAPVPDAELGPMRVQAPVPRFSATPGQVTHLGPPLGADNAEVYAQLLGFDDGRLHELHEQGVI
jgi:crotonobetainyl-CoA:carnitine CoA-transferase CaiB-like acyl-CoA transferase